MEALEEIAQGLVAPAKGILAADESTGTITKRFTTVGLKSEPELNRKYRQMLLTTPHVEKYLSGVILFDETVRQKLDTGDTFPEYLAKRGVIPGIKVDQGKMPAFRSEGEFVTKGLEGLDDRLKDYKNLGLKFTKWRAEYVIGEGTPSPDVISENAARLAQFAKISQEGGFVPIVEPEVIRDGNHDINKCEEATRAVLTAVFSGLERAKVDLAALILKTNMITSGKESPRYATAFEVAGATLGVIQRVMPLEPAGVVFLSGGQTPDEATDNLNQINIQGRNSPWQLSFSFARALQGEALELWRGKDENVKAAQKAFLKRLKMVAQARQGKLT